MRAHQAIRNHAHTLPPIPLLESVGERPAIVCSQPTNRCSKFCIILCNDLHRTAHAVTQPVITACPAVGAAVLNSRCAQFSLHYAWQAINCVTHTPSTRAALRQAWGRAARGKAGAGRPARPRRQRQVAGTNALRWFCKRWRETQRGLSKRAAAPRPHAADCVRSWRAGRGAARRARTATKARTDTFRGDGVGTPLAGPPAGCHAQWRWVGCGGFSKARYRAGGGCGHRAEGPAVGPPAPPGRSGLQQRRPRGGGAAPGPKSQEPKQDGRATAGGGGAALVGSWSSWKVLRGGAAAAASIGTCLAPGRDSA